MLWFCKERICKEAHVTCSFTRNWGRPTPGRQNRPLPSSQSHTQILTVSPASFFVPQTRSPRSLKQWPENVLNKRPPQKVEGFEISRASASRGRPLLVFTGLSPWAAGVLRATEVVFVSALLQTFHWKYSLGRLHMRLSFESTFFSFQHHWTGIYLKLFNWDSLTKGSRGNPGVFFCLLCRKCNTYFSHEIMTSETT